MGRTTSDLIEELDQEAKKFTKVALAVGFEKTTAFVFADDPKRQGKLDEAVGEGGEPVGFLAFILGEGGHALTLYTRPIEEYAHRRS